MVLVLGIVKASLEILGIGIGVKKVVLLMSVMGYDEIIMMSPFSRQDQNLCLLSLAFIIDWKVVSVRAWRPTGLISRGLGQGQTVPECGPSNQSKCYAMETQVPSPDLLLPPYWCKICFSFIALCHVAISKAIKGDSSPQLLLTA